MNTLPDSTALSTRPTARALLIPLVLCLTLVAGLLLVMKSAKPVKPPLADLPEVARTNLVRLDGRWCRTGQTNPFTGALLDYYPGGSRQSRAMVSNGLLEGLYEAWHTNGQLEIREYYRTNYSDGPRTKWYPDGQKLSESTIVLGKMQGIFRRWYENGKLAEEIPMRDGKIEGVGRSWYESGFQKTELKIHNGEVVESKNWQDGQKPGDRR